MKGYVHSVETFGAIDGPGIRYVVFMQGCPIRCIYCHNPDSWKPKTGQQTTVNQIVKNIKPYINYISNGGVTISGGEPLLQPRFVLKLIKKLKKLNLHVALDTAGTLPLVISKPVIDASDLILLDIKSLDNNMCTTVTGSPNTNTLSTLDYCEHTGKDVWIRHVVVPGYTLNFDMLKQLAQYLTKYKCVKNIDLLAFHKMGEYKWKELGYDYKLTETPAPTAEEMQKARQIFKDLNLPIVE